MNKSIAIAAILAAMFAAPVAPVQAGPVADFVDSCWFMPLLKDECAPSAPEAMDDAMEAPMTVAAATEEAAATFEWPAPMMMPNCAKAPAGSGHLYDCE